MFAFLWLFLTLGFACLYWIFYEPVFNFIFSRSYKLKKKRITNKFEKMLDVVFCISKFFQTLSQACLIVLVTEIVSHTIIHKGIIDIFLLCDNSIRFIIIVILLIWLFWIIYKKYSLYRDLADDRIIRHIKNEADLNRIMIRAQLTQKRGERKLSLISKLIPATIFSVIVENIFGAFKSEADSIIDYILSNKINIAVIAIVLIYIFWIYDTYNQINQSEKTLAEIKCKQFEFQRKEQPDSSPESRDI